MLSIQRGGIPMGGLVAVERKGGTLARITLTTKLTHPIRDRAVTDTKPLSDFLSRLLINKNGSQNFIAPMPRVGRADKKLLIRCPIHSAPAGKVPDIFTAIVCHYDMLKRIDS